MVGLVACLTVLGAAMMPPAANADYVYTTFDPPGSLNTEVYALNGTGTAAGSYRDASQGHGFIRDAGGNIVTFDPPGSLNTGVAALNESGTVAGIYAGGRPRQQLPRVHPGPRGHLHQLRRPR
jgi:hypothetical protein